MHLNHMGVWGLIVLVADIYAIINIAGSSTEPLKKTLWIVLILLLPFVGFLLWWFLGPKSAK